MQELRKIQKEITAALNNPSLSTTCLLERASLHSSQRLAIYRNSMTFSLMKVLKDKYPICEKIVGADFFRAMTKIYIEHTPSCSPNIDDYGSGLPDFIANFSPSQSLVYLKDVAQLEKLWHQALVGPDTVALDVDALRKVTEAEQAKLVFKLPLNSSLLRSDFPIHLIWELNQAGDQDESIIDLDKGGSKLFVWRKHRTPQIEIVNDEEWLLLTALKKGRDLENFSETQTHLIIELVGRGWINDFGL